MLTPIGEIPTPLLIALVLVILFAIYLIAKSFMDSFFPDEEDLKNNSPADSADTWLANNQGKPFTKAGKKLLTIIDEKTKKLNAKGQAIIKEMTGHLRSGDSKLDYVDDSDVVSMFKSLKTQGDVAIISAVFSVTPPKRQMMTWLRDKLTTSSSNDVVNHINKLPIYV